MRDFCALIRGIEKDPEAIINDLTVRDYLLLRQHIQLCDECYEAVERVNKKYPDEPSIGFGRN